MRWRTYEITFAGQAGATVCAAFDDCEVTVGAGTTTLHAELPMLNRAMMLIELPIHFAERREGDSKMSLWVQLESALIPFLLRRRAR